MIAELVRPLLHLAQTGPVGIDEGDGAGWAGIGAGRLAAAQVALLHLAGFLDVIDGAEWAGDGADLAADSGGFVHHFGACCLIHRDGLDRARVQAPGLVALGTGVRHFFAGVVEVKHLDARFGGGEGAVVLERTGHFALQTAGAFVCIDVQHLLHM